MTKPGEDLPRVDVLPNVPAGMVAVREAVQAEEAMVLHSVLVSNDVPAALVAASQTHVYARHMPMMMGVYVPPDRFDEAEALLADLPDDLTAE